jgi:hypothetical protein
MSQGSLRATIVLTAMLAVATSTALGKTQSLRARTGKGAATTANGGRSLELKMARTSNALRVQVRNRTGAEIDHGTVRVNVSFKNGVSQESRIDIANLPAGGTSPVNLRLFGDESRSSIASVEVLGSELDGAGATTALSRMPVHVHYD